MIMLTAAMIADLIFGDPQGWFHPVRLMGSAIDRTEKWLRQFLMIDDLEYEDITSKRIAGIITVVVIAVLFTLIPILVMALSGRIHAELRLAVGALMMYWMLAMKQLKVESMAVFQALKEGDTEKARKAVSMIVGRDTDRLDDQGIMRAAVETVAENTSDGVCAPLFYMLLFGAAGGWFYKAVNTMDSMLGYKNARYRYFGTAAAWTDDVINYIPSRLTAMIMILAAALLKLDYENAFNIWVRDADRSTSPNSGQTEAAAAGALGITLLGDTWYFGELHKKPKIGDARREIEAEDIRRVNALMLVTGILTAGIGIMCLQLFSLIL